MKKAQRGGFLVGLVIGLLIGLALALGVALYVTKVPVPFVNKVPQRTAEQDAAEAARNKSWDPNAGLAGKHAGRPSAAASAPASPAAAAPAATPTKQVPLPSIAPQPTSPTAAAPATRTSPPGAATGMMFFAQAGAYTRSDDAEAQRAKLALLGLDAKVSEREQAGRSVYRVRVGPFDSRAQADAAIDKLQAAGVESTLVRVERQ
jgi:cell division protein FtsN